MRVEQLQLAEIGRNGGQRQRRDERDEEGRNTPADPAVDDGAIGHFAVVVFIVLFGSRWPVAGPPPVIPRRLLGVSSYLP